MMNLLEENFLLPERVAHRVLGLFPLGDDFRINDDAADGPVGIVPGPAFPAGPVRRPIRPDVGVVLGAGDDSGQSLLMDIPPFLGKIGKDFIMVPAGDVLFLDSILVQVTLAHVKVVQVAVVDGDGAPVVLDDIPHQVAGMNDGLLGAEALGQVLDRPDHPERFSRSVPGDESSIKNIKEPAVFAEKPVMVGPELSSSVDGRVDPCDDPVAVRRMDAGRPGFDPRLDLFRRITKHPPEMLVPPHRVGFEVPIPENIECRPVSQFETLKALFKPLADLRPATEIPQALAPPNQAQSEAGSRDQGDQQNEGLP